MKAFRFSLQKLLDAKVALEKVSEIRMMKSLENLELNKRRLLALKAKLREQVVSIEMLKGVRTSRKELSVCMNYLNWVEKQIDEQAARVDECTKMVNMIREELLLIVRERKSIERLKDKERRSWHLETRRKEQGAMDDMAITGFIRRGMA